MSGDDSVLLDNGRFISRTEMEMRIAEILSKPTSSSLIGKIRHYIRVETWRNILDYKRLERDYKTEQATERYFVEARVGF